MSLVVAVLVSLALVGCGGGGDENAEAGFVYPADATDREQITAVIERWQEAAAADDGEGWCRDVVYPSERVQRLTCTSQEFGIQRWFDITPDDTAAVRITLKNDGWAEAEWRGQWRDTPVTFRQKIDGRWYLNTGSYFFTM